MTPEVVVERVDARTNPEVASVPASSRRAIVRSAFACRYRRAQARARLARLANDASCATPTDGISTTWTGGPLDADSVGVAIPGSRRGPTITRRRPRQLPVQPSGRVRRSSTIWLGKPAVGELAIALPRLFTGPTRMAIFHPRCEGLKDWRRRVAGRATHLDALRQVWLGTRGQTITPPRHPSPRPTERARPLPAAVPILKCTSGDHPADARRSCGGASGLPCRQDGDQRVRGLRRRCAGDTAPRRDDLLLRQRREHVGRHALRGGVVRALPDGPRRAPRDGVQHPTR
jgi:hypothetical protein